MLYTKIKKMNVLENAESVFDLEMQALSQTKNNLGEMFEKFIEKIMHCEGKIVMTGMGKSGHIARKIAATFSSLGTPSFFLHPAEALHGDLGMISERDIVIAISHSGESEEILRMISSIKLIGASFLSITCNADSTLTKHSDLAEVLPSIKEACHLGLAPTSSTTVTLVYGDALAVTVSRLRNFKNEDFGLFHPAGALGKRLLTKVSDVMFSGGSKPIVKAHELLKTAIIELGEKGTGLVTVVNEGKVIGVITDGDLRRALERGEDIYALKVAEIMTLNPVCIEENKLAVEALKLLQRRNISAMPVVDNEGKYRGVITLQSAIKAL